MTQAPIKPNPQGIPSLWYMPLVGEDGFFDGFGFEAYRKRFPRWKKIRIDEEERRHPPQSPLLPFLERLSREIPKTLRRTERREAPWLLWDFDRSGDRRS